MEEKLKELETKFEGKGEVRGFTFEQIQKSKKAYLYKITNVFGQTHWEVFRRKINKQFNCVSYPRAKSFGDWAWCFTDFQMAINKFEEIK